MGEDEGSWGRRWVMSRREESGRERKMENREDREGVGEIREGGEKGDGGRSG